jgi:hypothetical protein
MLTTEETSEAFKDFEDVRKRAILPSQSDSAQTAPRARKRRAK